MTARERDRLIRKMFQDDMRLLRAKGHDYSGEENCLSNLEEFGFFGIVVRLNDKFQRLKNFVHSKKLNVNDESIEDTLRDIRNYCYLAQILLQKQR